MQKNYEWDLIEKFISHQDKNNKNVFLIDHQIKSYEYFIENDIKEIIKTYNPYIISKNNMDYKLTFSNPRISRPIFRDIDGKTIILTPSEVLNKELTYSVPLIVDIKQEIVYYSSEETKTPEDVKEIEKVLEYYNNDEIIAHIPLMIGTKFCSNTNEIFIQNNEIDKCFYDNGGYFIIDGTEKVIISQERMCDNKPYIFKSKGTKYSFYCDIRSNIHISKISQVLSLYFYPSDITNSSGTISFYFPHMAKELPIFLLFKYLGIDSDKDIINLITENNISEYRELIEPSLIEFKNLNLNTKEEINNYFESKIKQNGKQFNKKIKIDKIFKQDVLPHLGNNYKLKAFYIANVVKLLIDTITRKQKLTDRDHFKNKRIETTGILMAQMFRILYENFLYDVRKNASIGINRYENIDIIKIIKKSANITNGMRFSLATGNWNMKAKNNKKIGVAQVLSRLTYISTCSHLRRINAPIGKSAKILIPRKLHNSQFMYFCCAETPEGAVVGLVKNLTIGSFITSEYSIEPVKEILRESGLIFIDDINIDDYIHDMTKVFINGIFMGIYTGNSYDLVVKLKFLRMKMIINSEISISFIIHMNEIIIHTDRGRPIRPLIIVENNKIKMSIEEMSKLSWKDNIKYGNIEYIDVEESETCMIALNKTDLENKEIEYTHLEIHPALMFGICASLIPLPNHNQSPRNIYQSAMCKQAIGINATNFLNRMDTMMHALHYPQRPLVYTKAADILGFNDLPAGQNIIVAIATYSGFNQEDSVILNKSAIERGLFHSTYYRTYSTDEKKNITAMAKERICVPDKDNTINIKYGSYDKLDVNGIIKLEQKVSDKDVIIGKISPIIDKSQGSSKKNIKYKDNSVMLKHNEVGISDKIVTTYNHDEHKLIKVRVRSHRVPIIGDKFASRQGQKGTVGMILPEEDMPFTEDGFSPDLIINPHAIPSRMTVATILECVMGKYSAEMNSFVDGTPFRDIDFKDIDKLLEHYGFSKSGKEVLYNGETGEKIEAEIFIGPIFYQKLKHMVSDKIHSRTTGPVTNLTRQPLEGRSREGGLRFGEMETQCISSHGMAGFLKERTFDSSDSYETYICDECGLIAEYNEENKEYSCRGCKDNKIGFTKINLPYATKLLINTLIPMSLIPRIETEK